MIATLNFNLDEPEDREEFKRAQKAFDLAQVISDFGDKSLRRRIKYESDAYTEKEIELLEKLREELWELVKEHGCLEVID